MNIPGIDQALAVARALIGQPNGVTPPKRTEYSDDRGRTFTRVSAAEWRRLLSETLPKVNLLLLTTDEVIEAETETLVVTFSLTRTDIGDTRTLTRSVPLTQAPNRALAAQWAHTRAVNAVARTLLWQWDSEDEAQDEPGEEAAPAPAKQLADEAMSDGGPVREELLPLGYRKNTRVWSYVEIEREVSRLMREHDEDDTPSVSDVHVGATRYYRVRWSRPSGVERKGQSSLWSAWRTSTVAPRDYDSRRWVRCYDWPAHPDDPKPETDSRPIEEVLGGTLPDTTIGTTCCACGEVLPRYELRATVAGHAFICINENACAERIGEALPDITPAAGSPVATPDSPASCVGGALSPDASGSPSRASRPASTPSVTSTAGAINEPGTADGSHAPREAACPSESREGHSRPGSPNTPQRDASTVEAHQSPMTTVTPHPLGLSSPLNGVSSVPASTDEMLKGSLRVLPPFPDPSPVEPAGDAPLVVDVPGGAAPTVLIEPSSEALAMLYDVLAARKAKAVEVAAPALAPTAHVSTVTIEILTAHRRLKRPCAVCGQPIEKGSYTEVGKAAMHVGCDRRGETA